MVATLGSKEGFANMAQAITAPGDVVLVPNPSYPIHAFGFLMAPAASSARCRRSPGRSFFTRSSARSPFDPAADRVWSAIPRTRRPASPRLDFYRDVVPLRRSMDFLVLSTLPMLRSISTTSRLLDPAGAGRDRGGGRVYFDVEDVFDGGLARRLRVSATSGCSRSRASNPTSTMAPIRRSRSPPPRR